MALLREWLDVVGVKRLERVQNGQPCTVTGLVIARQHPETANGIVFLYLEDEFSHCQASIHPQLWE